MIVRKRTERLQVMESSRLKWPSRNLVSVSFLLLATAMGGIGTAYLPHAHADGDNIIARINGEAVHESDIIRNIPADLMDDGIADLYKVKLDRLIRQTEMRQFLKLHKISVLPAEVEASLAQLRKTPPSLGCACCRYKNLDQFLHSNGYTLSEFRQEILNQIGLNKYIEVQWAQQYATKQSKRILMDAQRQRVEKDYTRAWHVFFNTFQQVDDESDPAKMKAKSEAKAQQAWQMLQQGQSFASVAKNMSEDQVSKDKGGELGFIERNAYGKDFANTLAHLKPGAVSRPFKSIYGFHIIKWEPIHDEELLEICKADFRLKQIDQTFEKIDTSAKVVRYDSK